MERTSTDMAKGSIFVGDFHLWLNLVEIIQFRWDNWSISTELGLTVMLLIPKINVDTLGISLIELVWKVV